MLKRSRALKSRKWRMTGTAVYGTVCTVVREDGGRKPSSYPIYGICNQNVLISGCVTGKRSQFISISFLEDNPKYQKFKCFEGNQKIIHPLNL